MFAGPNGSGKSSLKGVLPAGLQGIYLNPDDLEHDLGKRGFLDLNEYGFPGIAADALQYILKSHFLQQAFSRKELSTLSADGSILHLGGLVPNSYLASVLCDFLRQGLLRGGLSFTFETVMSHPGKVAILAQAQNSGYRTYLYYVATEDPIINVSRVANRVRLGGHPVPSDKIGECYYRSLELLVPAIRHTNRAYIFDNSGEGADQTWIAEITEGRELELKSDRVPAWFQNAVIEKLGPH